MEYTTYSHTICRIMCALCIMYYTLHMHYILHMYYIYHAVACMHISAHGRVEIHYLGVRTWPGLGSWRLDQVCGAVWSKCGRGRTC